MRPDFVLGDRFGTSCNGELTRLAANQLKALGYAGRPSTSPMPAATSPSITAARTRPSTCFRSRSTAPSTWTRRASRSRGHFASAR